MYYFILMYLPPLISIIFDVQLHILYVAYINFSFTLLGFKVATAFESN